MNEKINLEILVELTKGFQKVGAHYAIETNETSDIQTLERVWIDHGVEVCQQKLNELVPDENEAIVIEKAQTVQNYIAPPTQSVSQQPQFTASKPKQQFNKNVNNYAPQYQKQTSQQPVQQYPQYQESYSVPQGQYNPGNVGYQQPVQQPVQQQYQGQQYPQYQNTNYINELESMDITPLVPKLFKSHPAKGLSTYGNVLRALNQKELGFVANSRIAQNSYPQVAQAAKDLLRLKYNVVV